MRKLNLLFSAPKMRKLQAGRGKYEVKKYGRPRSRRIKNDAAQISTGSNSIAA
ncbi:MAG: hypothetical protein JWN60_1738 [Acidobacteria bacterium]|jgi:hypothetical protein|nr:hypothetical protein [Acidobacteriota bacterium]